MMMGNYIFDIFLCVCEKIWQFVFYGVYVYVIVVVVVIVKVEDVYFFGFFVGFFFVKDVIVC